MNRPSTERPLTSDSGNQPVWIRVGQLLDGLSTQPMRDAHLVYDAMQIRYVGTDPPPRDVLGHEQREPDARFPQYTAMPGLIEGHAHLFLDGAPIDLEQRKAYLRHDSDWFLDRARARLPNLLAFGIATIRDAGDKDNVGLTLSREHQQFRDQVAPTPYVDSPGAAIHHAGRYGKFMGSPLEDHEDLQACVASRVDGGSDRIKMLVSGIINFKAGAVTKSPQLSSEEVTTLVNASQSLGKQTFAHASGVDGIENSIAGRVTTVEHGFFVTDDQLAAMRDRGIGWVPTFAPVQLQIDQAAAMGWNAKIVENLKRIIDAHSAALRKAHELGVTIIAGSDAGSCGVAHGGGFLWELELMERAGMPPLAILNSATGVSAEKLNFHEHVGRLTRGHRSRMLLLKHDPTQTVRHLQQERIVLFDGQAFTVQGLPTTEGL